MDCYSKWAIPWVVSLLCIFNQWQSTVSDWITKYMKERLISQNVKMFPSLCKLLLIIVLKEQHYLHIVTFLYQVIVIVLHAIWPKSENVKRIFLQSNYIFIVSAWLTANPQKMGNNIPLFCRLNIFGHLNTKSGFFYEIILKINSASCTFKFNR